MNISGHAWVYPHLRVSRERFNWGGKDHSVCCTVPWTMGFDWIKHTHKNTNTHVHIHTQVHTGMHMLLLEHIGIHTHIHICAHMHTQACSCTHKYTHAHTQAHSRTHKYTHASCTLPHTEHTSWELALSSCYFPRHSVTRCLVFLLSQPRASCHCTFPAEMDHTFKCELESTLPLAVAVDYSVKAVRKGTKEPGAGVFLNLAVLVSHCACTLHPADD